MLPLAVLYQWHSSANCYRKNQFDKKLAENRDRKRVTFFCPYFSVNPPLFFLLRQHLPNSATLCFDHRVARLTAKGCREFRHIHHSAVATESPWRMRVSLHL